jgi:hypothetical protein
MPKQEIDYTNTIMYKIVCKDLNITDLYVGSTTDFRRRKCYHKADLKRKTHKLQTIINENGGWENWDMIEIEKYPCNDNNEARARERYWYEELKATLNGISPLAVWKEKDYNKKYYLENREKILEEKKKYRIKNKEKIIEQMKEYRQKLSSIKKLKSNEIVYASEKV